MTQIKKKIIVVDDEPDIVRGIQLALEAKGYEVLCAYDGQTAIALSIEHKPDLMLLDVVMPKMDGYHVCHELKNSYVCRSMPIIMLSASAQDIDKYWGLESGVNEYLTKPISMAKLLKKISEHLDKV